MEWIEPVLLRCDFEVGPKSSPATVCLGFPQRFDERYWTCAFQFQGVGRDDDQLKDGYVHRMMEYHGLGALIEASNAIRSRLDALVDVRRRETPYEFVFPRFLPTSSWFDLYDWAREFVAFEVEQMARTSWPQMPPVEQLPRSTWDGAKLLDRQFKFAGGRKVTVRLGFPVFSQERKCWTCAFQLRGVEDSLIKTASGENGVLAVANAADHVRAALDQVGASSGKDSHELTFPAHVPTEFGLEFHRQLSQAIDTEIKNIEQEDDDKAERRAIDFNEILADLPPAERL